MVQSLAIQSFEGWWGRSTPPFLLPYYGKLAEYTCQLFLRYRREIFILGVLRFLTTTRSFPKIPEEFRSLPKTSEVPVPVLGRE